MKTTIRAGAGIAPIRLNEKDMPLKAFTGIHDGLFVRCLIADISGISSRLVFLSIELTSLMEDPVRQFQKTAAEAAGTDSRFVFVSVTHTFSAPHIPPHITSDAERRVYDILMERIGTAVRESASAATADLAETSVRYGTAPCSININRNVLTKQGWWIGSNPKEYSDHTVRVLTLSHGDRPFASVLNYDIQASVMDQSESALGGKLISGDLAGDACRRLEANSGAVVFFLPGAAGDQSPVRKAVVTDEDGNTSDLHEEGFLIVSDLSRQLSASALQAIQQSQSVLVSSANLIDRSVRLPRQIMKYPTKELRPHRSYQFEPAEGYKEISLTLLQLDSIQVLLTVPELNSRFGAKIRNILGDRTLIGTLVNGGCKYLPEEQDFERITYTAMNTEIGRGADKIFLDAVKRLHDEAGRA